MTTNNGTNDSNGDRLAGLQKREAELRAKIAAEQERVRKREAREQQRLFRIVGEICCKAAQRLGLGTLLKQILETEMDEKTRDFLHQKGLL